MSEQETVTFNLEINLEPTYSEIRRLEAVLFRCMGIIRRISGNEDVGKAIAQIQRLIVVIRMLQVAFNALNIALTGGGFIPWAYALTTVASVGMFAIDPMLEANNR